MFERISVSVFANKQSKMQKQVTKIETDADYLEEMCAKQIDMAVDNLSTYIPEIISLTSPIIDSAYKTQTNFQKSVLTNVKTTKSGFWNTMLYYNGTTSKLHTEKDCAYTMITVPKQKGSASRNHSNKPMFLFKLNKKNQLMIPLASGVDFVYNGQCITHRQSCVSNDKNTENAFYNISSYANGKLFNHIRNTFSRLKDKN